MIIAPRRPASICLRLNCSFSPACLPSSHRSRAQIKTQRRLFAPFGTCTCFFTAAFVLQLLNSPSRTVSFSGALYLRMFLLSYNLYYANLDVHQDLHSKRFSSKTCRSWRSPLDQLNLYIYGWPSLDIGEHVCSLRMMLLRRVLAWTMVAHVQI